MTSKEVDLNKGIFWNKFKTYDIIINSAGVIFKDDMNVDGAFDKLMNVNFGSCVMIIRLAPIIMPNGGNVVFVGSSAALSPRGMIAIYSASKAAVLSLTRSGAELLKKHNIRVNCVSPSRTDTPRT